MATASIFAPSTIIPHETEMVPELANETHMDPAVQSPDVIANRTHTIPFLGKRPSRFIASPSVLAAAACSRASHPNASCVSAAKSARSFDVVVAEATSGAQAIGSVPLPRQTGALPNTVSFDNKCASQPISGNHAKHVSAPLPITALHLPLICQNEPNKITSSYAPNSFLSGKNSYALSQDSALFDFFRGDAELTPFAEYSGGGGGGGGGGCGTDLHPGDDETNEDGYFGNWQISDSLMVEQGYSVASHSLWRSRTSHSEGTAVARSEGWDGALDEKGDSWACMTV
ncbi:hypothetical protein IAU59_000848 [Kwoniella sp. CBS 9459]